jgi:hypothetical protein
VRVVLLRKSLAEVAELADAHGSGPCTRKGVGVRVPSSAPLPSLSVTCKLVLPTLLPLCGGEHRANREVNLTKRIRTTLGNWRYCPVVLSANGRVKPDAVLVDGREERHPEGSYNIEWREGKKRVGLSIGKDPQDAAARRLRKEAELNAVNNGVNLVPEGKPQGRRRIADAIGEYLSEIKLSRSTATHSAYTLALRNFTDSCQKSHLEEIDRKDQVNNTFSSFSGVVRDH